MIPAKEFEGEWWIRAEDIHLLTKEKSREWVGLTDAEQEKAYEKSNGTFNGWGVFYRNIEQALKEKNT